MQFEKWPYYTYFVKGLGRPYISQSPKWKKQKQKPRLISLCSWLYFEGNVVIFFFLECGPFVQGRQTAQAVALPWGVGPRKKPAGHAVVSAAFCPSLFLLCLWLSPVCLLSFSLCHSRVHTRCFSLCYLSVGF